MKRRVFACSIIAICLAIAVYGTIAYFTSEERAHNVITSGNIDIELQEWADTAKTTPFPEDGVSGVMPGATVTKIVEVTNTGSNPAYIRMKVDKSVELQDGVSGDASILILDFDEDNWTYSDGYYYYNKALESGETTEPLFAQVEFDKDMGNVYQNSTAVVDVTAYAVQVANNGDSALTASGWPADMKVAA